LNRPTAIEHQIASRVAKTIDPLNNDTIDDPLVRIRLNKVSQLDQNIIIHYTHETRFTNYKKNVHQLWDQIFAATPVMNSKLIVGNQNNRHATKILVRRRPHRISEGKITNIVNSN
jgi:hypothetical protein